MKKCTKNNSYRFTCSFYNTKNLLVILGLFIVYISYIQDLPKFVSEIIGKTNDTFINDYIILGLFGIFTIVFFEFLYKHKLENKLKFIKKSGVDPIENKDLNDDIFNLNREIINLSNSTKGDDDLIDITISRYKDITYERFMDMFITMDDKDIENIKILNSICKNSSNTSFKNSIKTNPFYKSIKDINVGDSNDIIISALKESIAKVYKIDFQGFIKHREVLLSEENFAAEAGLFRFWYDFILPCSVSIAAFSFMFMTYFGEYCIVLLSTVLPFVFANIIKNFNCYKSSICTLYFNISKLFNRLFKKNKKFYLK